MYEYDAIKWQTILDYFLNNTNWLYSISDSERNDLMHAACIICEEESDYLMKSKAITILYLIAFSDNISLEECWQIYWIITATLFSYSEVRLLEGSLRRLYNHIYHFIEGQLDISYPYIPIENRDLNTIIVVVNQFLSQYHSSTLRAIDYSYALKKHLKKNVIIINTSELNFYTSPHLLPSVRFNFDPQLSGVPGINYKDTFFEFYQVDTLMPNLEIYQALLNIIYDLKPLFIYNIGDSNILADLCSSFTTTASLPCSYEIPISCSKYLLVGRSLDQRDATQLNEINSNQHIIETEMNFQVRQDDIQYTRSDFRLDENTFILCIIGNRLDYEIDEAFIQLMKKIVCTSDIHIMLIGNIKNEKRIVDEIPKEKHPQLHLLGYQKYGNCVLKMSNLYVNPRRSGGGRSSFEALSQGIPVITLQNGDVFYTCGSAFSVKDYDEMYSKIIEYYSNSYYYDSMSKLAIQRYIRLSDIAGTQKALIDAIMANELQDIE